MTQGTERSPERWDYDVFLSFRGVDVRKNFLSHLYASLRRTGIKTFKDDVELERGEYISEQLLEAIETSKILIVVLSKDYASSAWCLDELAHIMKIHKMNPSQLVFPVFLNVDPSDVRRQKGSYAASFDKHESRHPPSKIKDWKEALTLVANKSGWDVRYRIEAECIEEITKEIFKRLPCRYMNVPSYPVGMRSRLKHLSSLLRIDPAEVRVVGIYGMGGIGKTTLAKMAFNEFSHHFEGSSFLENFKEFFKEPSGRTRLQRQLLSDILRRNDIEANGIDHAVKERFRSRRVFIVLDDVDDIRQLESAAINLSYFGRGSRIIITTRNSHFLKQIPVQESYQLKELHGDESLELLSWKAFRTSEPPEEFLQLSEKVVVHCGGLPLAVEVVGAFLIGRSIPEWESALEMWKAVPEDNIQAKLKISFDALNRVEKVVFLDIACFFTGMDIQYVTCILDGCKLTPVIVLNILVERCLITLSDNNIMMHDLLRDMGREIVRDIPSKNCGERSRLWNQEDVVRVLARKKGTLSIEGLSLKVEESEVENFEVDAFSKMEDLRLLQLSYVNLSGSYEDFPNELRWIYWRGFSSEFLPTKLSLRRLVVLDMQYSNLTRLWEANPQRANMVKYLDLSHSLYLRETPDFSYFPNVEKVLLVNCKSLVLVHKSIGFLDKKLVLLNLSSCTELKALPEEFYKLKSLETLLLTECSNFERLDDALGELEALTTLFADFTALKGIPSSINQLKKLKWLSFAGCKGLSSDDINNPHSEKSSSISLLRPISFNGLNCMRGLSLAYCNLSDGMMPKDFGSLSSLKFLNLSGNNFCNLQTDFSSLKILHKLQLSDCLRLQSFHSLPNNLFILDAYNCTSLQRTPDFSECSHLHMVELSECHSLVETPGIHKLKGVTNMPKGNPGTSKTIMKTKLEDWLKRNPNCIYIPGYSLPNWVSFKEEMCSFSFTVPEIPNSDPAIGITVWTRYVCQGGYTMVAPLCITVKNVTRGGTWVHDLEVNIFFSHETYLTDDFRIETGDQMEVDVDCADRTVVLVTGVALAYSARDSSDFSFSDLRFTNHEDFLNYTADDGMCLTCRRTPLLQYPFQTVVHYMGYSTDGELSDLYACSLFPETCRYRENTLRVIEENDECCNTSAPGPMDKGKGVLHADDSSSQKRKNIEISYPYPHKNMSRQTDFPENEASTSNPCRDIVAVAADQPAAIDPPPSVATEPPPFP